jgi:hypothetical protein
MNPTGLFSTRSPSISLWSEALPRTECESQSLYSPQHGSEHFPWNGHLSHLECEYDSRCDNAPQVTLDGIEHMLLVVDRQDDGFGRGE